jgi:2',3'-cyclic-nucleotide 2'-phosphodiesterase (5'-nucleotidase family)
MKEKRRALVAAGAACGLAALVGVLTSRPPVTEDRIWIQFTAGIQGHLEPCGCDPHERGGLAKRLTILAQRAQEGKSHLVLDAGDFTGLPSIRGFENPPPDTLPSPAKLRFGRIHTDAILRGFEAGRYDAVAVGEREFDMGWKALWDVKQRVPLVSANVVYSDSQRRVFAPFVTRVVARGTFFGIPYGGVKVGIFSLLFPCTLTRPGDVYTVQARALNEDAKEVLHTLRSREGCHVVVCLFHGTAAYARKMAEQVPGIDILIVGHNGHHGGGVHAGPGGSRIAHLEVKGRSVGELEVLLDPDRRLTDVRFHRHDLSPSTPDHPDGVRIRDAYLAALRAADLAPDRPEKNEIAYRGSEACRRCHEKEWNHWKTTKHAAAYAVLSKKCYDPSPECLQCHTTGYGREKGFTTAGRTPHLANVGCEVCHGPRGRHTDEMEERERKGLIRPPITDARLTRRSAGTPCALCHTAERDPRFKQNLARRLREVTHR